MRLTSQQVHLKIVGPFLDRRRARTAQSRQKLLTPFYLQCGSPERPKRPCQSEVEQQPNQQSPDAAVSRGSVGTHETTPGISLHLILISRVCSQMQKPSSDAESSLISCTTLSIDVLSSRSWFL